MSGKIVVRCDNKTEHRRTAMCGGVALIRFSVLRMSGLLADTELLLGDEGAVAVDVHANQVIEQFATLTNQHLQCTLSRMILLVDLQVLGQVGNTV